MNWPDGSLKKTATIQKHLDKNEKEKAKKLHEISNNGLPPWKDIDTLKKFQPNNDTDTTAHVNVAGGGKDTTPRPLLEQSQLFDFAHRHVEELITDGNNVTKEGVIKHIMGKFKNGRPQIQLLFPSKQTSGAEVKSSKNENENLFRELVRID